MGESEKRARIIDFLYRDLSRIDSMFAQLYQGTLREVATTESHSSSTKKTFGINLNFLGGKRAGLKANSDTIEKRIEPHDQRIVDMLAQLKLSPYEDDLSILNTGQVVLLKGSLFMRNYQSLQTVIPMLPNITSGLPGSAGPKGKKISKGEIKTMVDLLKLIPVGLEVELLTEKEQSVIGFVKEEYLEDSHNDLLRIYGNHIPGEWHVLGVYSSVQSKTKQGSPASMRSSLDEMASAIQEIYITEKNAITPILIFRELSY